MAGYDGLQVGIEGDAIGKFIDERNKTDVIRPTVRDLTDKCNCEELKEMWITALENQIAELKKTLEDGSDASWDLLRCLEKELVSARKFDADKAEKKSSKKRR